MKILIIGISGMLGSAVFHVFARTGGFDVTGTVRDISVSALFPVDLREKIVAGVDVLQENTLVQV